MLAVKVGDIVLDFTLVAVVILIVQYPEWQHMYAPTIAAVVIVIVQYPELVNILRGWLGSKYQQTHKQTNSTLNDSICMLQVWQQLSCW